MLSISRTVSEPITLGALIAPAEPLAKWPNATAVRRSGEERKLQDGRDERKGKESHRGRIREERKK